MGKNGICVIGLGYIGLPTSTLFATHGHAVLGVDINETVVKALNRGKIVIEEPNLDILVHNAVTAGNLRAATVPQPAEAFIIAVPTPVTPEKKADMRHVVAAAESIVPYLRPGNLVILESTSPVGTVEELLVPILRKSGLNVGSELFVGYSPERVLPGRILTELVNNDRVVGGINPVSAERIRALYRSFVKGEIYSTDATTAEMCKLVENTYRDINIAFANELAKISENLGINVWELIDLCNKHPRVNVHQPGPGVGGHCLAVDPWFIVDKDPETARIIRLARETNDSMPHHVLKRIEEILALVDGKKKVTVLGITYKPDIDDIRESPGMELVRLLAEKDDIEVAVYDPHAKVDFPGMAQSIFEAVDRSDLAVLVVNHTDFKDLPLLEMGKRMRHKLVYDTKGFFDRQTLVRLGYKHYLLGENIESAGHISSYAAQVAATQ